MATVLYWLARAVQGLGAVGKFVGKAALAAGVPTWAAGAAMVALVFLVTRRWPWLLRFLLCMAAGVAGFVAAGGGAAGVAVLFAAVALALLPRSRRPPVVEKVE